MSPCVFQGIRSQKLAKVPTFGIKEDSFVKTKTSDQFGRRALESLFLHWLFALRFLTAVVDMSSQKTVITMVNMAIILALLRATYPLAGVLILCIYIWYEVKI